MTDTVKARRAAAKIIDQPGVVTHTTAMVAGEQHTEVAIYQARTEHARMTVTIGQLMMIFLSAETVQKVLEGFAAVRPVLMGVDNTAAPVAQRGAEFSLNVLSITWLYPPTYAVVRGNRYSQESRRTINWVDVHMGPLTWRIADHVGYNSLIDGLRNAHKTATVAFLDGGKYRKDPTRADAFTE